MELTEAEKRHYAQAKRLKKEQTKTYIGETYTRRFEIKFREDSLFPWYEDFKPFTLEIKDFETFWYYVCSLLLLIPVDNSDYQAEQALKNVLSILCEHQFFEVKFKHKVHGNARPRSENN